jgi:hypothetical protein
MGQFLPPNHDAGDANTLGGYQAVHARPAAFEGKDGESYSVEIVTDESGDTRLPYAAYLLFVRWGHGGSVAAGHLETEYLVHGVDEASVRAEIGKLELRDVKRVLDELIDRDNPPSAPWYEVMRDA